MTNEQIAKLVAAEEKRKAYRAVYNQRPEVKERRAEYMKKRNADMRAVYAAFKSGELNFGGTRVDMTTGAVEEVIG